MDSSTKHEHTIFVHVVRVRIEPLIVALLVLNSIKQEKECRFWTLKYNVKWKPKLTFTASSS